MSVVYDPASNRMTNAGYEYDAAGNQTRTLAENGQNWQHFEYDAAGRLVKVTADDGAGQSGTTVQRIVYGATNQRLIVTDGDESSSSRTYYAGSLAEYTEGVAGTNSIRWTKSYVYLGDNLLSTMTPNGTDGEQIEHHHPDRLGTRIITNPQTGTSYEQTTMLFGTALNSESSGSTSRRFTSYDRSQTTGLDYAQNRHYDSQQGRFTTVDPIGMSAASLSSPQTLNLYSYCGNDPINHTDPDGLFFGKLFNAIGKALKVLAVAVSVAIAVVTIALAGPVGSWGLLTILNVISTTSNAASSVLSSLGYSKAARVFGFIGTAARIASTGIGFINETLKSGDTWRIISEGASLASQTLDLFGFSNASLILNIVSKGANFVSTLKGNDTWEKISVGSSLVSDALSAAGLTAASRVFSVISSGADFVNTRKSNGKNAWKWFKSIANTASEIAGTLGANQLGGILGFVGVVEDATNLRNALKGKLSDENVKLRDKINNSPNNYINIPFVENEGGFLIRSGNFLRALQPAISRTRTVLP